ncbi:hypothetical protein DOY81_009013 [Sarcophaga bullata]|nr:hypothetical protein DOY81_009013 [Sarcophaga bullata]
MTSNNTGDNNASVSKIQKTIVTVPTIKSLNDDKYKNHQTPQQQQALTKSTQQSLLAGNNNLNQQTLIRKHKISDINTEIQRITTTSDNPGPPEIKKSAPNSRVVVISSNNQPKILNSSIQQPGRITATLTLPSQTKTTTNSSGGSIVQASSVTQNGNKLYTILKPSAQEQKPATKLYSVLKTNNNQMTATSTSSVLAVSGVSTSTTATNAGAGASVKPLINKQYLIQQQHKLLQQKQHQNATNQSIDSLNTKTTTLTKYVLPIKIKEEPADANLNANTNNNNSTDFVSSTSISLPMGKDDVDAIDPLVGGVRRKHCNCSKSQCLKLYCDCFANGEFCQDCTCKDCFNNLENEDERQRAIKSCLERNPNAFKPKITSSRDQADMRLHNKGCNCKRSGCLKNYCECYEAKIPCSSNCKCVGCRNVEDRPDLDMDPIDPKIMASIAMASGETVSVGTQKRSYEKSQREFNGSVQRCCASHKY